MPLRKLEFERSWNSSADFPAYEDSEQQVRADLQYHPDAIRDYLNEEVVPAVDGLEEEQRRQGETLEEHGQAIVDLAAGDPPEAVRAARADFGAEDWAAPLEGEGVFLAIPREVHKRKDGSFGFTLYDGERTGTWSTAGASAAYDPETGEVTLWAEEAFTGHIVFYGV